MTHAGEWLCHAESLVEVPSDPSLGKPSQIAIRRAISAAYYGVFHMLTHSGSHAFAAGGEKLQFQTARAFNHATMRKVCDAYVRSPSSPFPTALDHLNHRLPSPQLIQVAQSFGVLQESRYAADYDMRVSFELEDAKRLIQLAQLAASDFASVSMQPDTVVFLTALLLADRWTRRG